MDVDSIKRLGSRGSLGPAIIHLTGDFVPNCLHGLALSLV